MLLTVSCPVAAPEAVGAKPTCSVTVCCGFSVIGKRAPEKVKPVPVSVAELIVTGAVPLEVNVTGCVEEEPTVTLPKLRLCG